MKPLARSTLFEATMIVTAAMLLSFVFTGIMGKGLFRVSQTSKGPTSAEAGASTFLTFEEVRGLYLQGHALFIDARDGYDFSVGHIKGAVSLPLREFNKKHPLLADLSKDRLLVIYCDGTECNSSAELARMLYESGYSNVKVFFGGWNEWLAHKQPEEP
jgi:rhodanese-related sulfurtransferase